MFLSFDVRGAPIYLELGFRLSGGGVTDMGGARKKLGLTDRDVRWHNTFNVELP